MERSRAVLLTLVYVWASRISGAEVEMRVRPGDNVTLYSDCVWKIGFKTVWFRSSSHKDSPTVMTGDMMSPRYSFVSNNFNRTHDLLVRNVSESDLGLYYCALQDGVLSTDKRPVYNKGNRTTRLSLLNSTVPCADLPQTTSTPPVSDCSICWKLLISVCPVFVVIFSSCVCCICHYRKKADDDEAEQRGNMERTGKRNEVEEEDEVCYASLDLPSRGHKHLKKMKRRVEGSDFSTYSEVKLTEYRSSEEDVLSEFRN